MKSYEKGNLAEGKAIGYFINQGYLVSIPFGTSCPYDLIVEKEGVCKRVSIKSTSNKENNVAYSVNLFQVGRKKKAIPFNNKSSDLLLIYISPEDKFVLFNTSEIKSKYSINVR
jgi:hypothetical protein